MESKTKNLKTEIGVMCTIRDDSIMQTLSIDCRKLKPTLVLDILCMKHRYIIHGGIKLSMVLYYKHKK